MSLFPSTFKIRDLEEFSGVKAHTIRIWEKRYGLLAPDRTDTNIRHYTLDELKTILNVAYLNKHGHKISRIAAMSPVERDRLVREMAVDGNTEEEALNSLKLAMLDLNETMLAQVTERYSAEHGFQALFEKVYIPLLEHVGVLWQTSAICPAQEHFVSNFIRKKVISFTDQLPPSPGRKDRTFVLYLPEDEIHELGLLYIDHVLRSQGERTIYLGQSVPQGDLKQVASIVTGELIFVTFLVVPPNGVEPLAYVKNLRAMLPDRHIRTHIAGAPLSALKPAQIPPGIKVYATTVELIAAMKSLS
jgi:DNA-binding transcriptional MerR regulator